VLKDEHLTNLSHRQQGFSFEGLETTGPKAWGEAERAHDRFDKLSGTSSSRRLRTDTLSEECIGSIKSKIESCSNVWKFATKFIAHASDPSSRTGLSNDQKGVTLQSLSACHKALFQVAAFIGVRLLQDSMPGSIPTPQFDPIANLDKPWIDMDSFEKARDRWEHHFESIKQWESEPFD
jgi:hypothetical protein